MELENLIAGVGRSVQQAQAVLDRACADQYLTYFTPRSDESGQTTLAPRTLSLALPGADKDRVVELPLLTLCSHSTMSFDQVTVKLNVSLDTAQDGHSLDAIPVATGQGGHQIELVFRRQEPSEAVSRFNETAGQIL